MHDFKTAYAARPGEFEFLTFLLLGCDEEADVKTTEIVNKLTKRKKDARFAQDIVNKAELKKTNPGMSKPKGTLVVETSIQG